MIAQAPFRLHRFHGGLHLDDRKALSTGTPIAEVPLPPLMVLPLTQHIGGAAKPCVQVGDRVRRGQTVAHAQGVVSSPVHAPTSGRITAIEARPVPHPSGLSADCLVLEPLLRSAGIFKHEGRLTVWMTDDRLRLPVQMKSKVVVGSITAELTDYRLGRLEEF